MMYRRGYGRSRKVLGCKYKYSLLVRRPHRRVTTVVHRRRGGYMLPRRFGPMSNVSPGVGGPIYRFYGKGRGGMRAWYTGPVKPGVSYARSVGRGMGPYFRNAY